MRRVAAGPVGRHAEGATDWKMRAQVLTYSRARGVFAGISLNGAVIKQDRDDTRAFYGRMVPYRSLLTGAHPAPADANPFLETLRRYAPVQAASAQAGDSRKAAGQAVASSWELAVPSCLHAIQSSCCAMTRNSQLGAPNSELLQCLCSCAGEP